MRYLLLPCALAALALSAQAQAQPPHDAPANGLKEWRVGSNGVAVMPLAGGKSATDLTTFRIRYPAGFKADSTAHYHLGTEHVIILKGTLLVGLGDRTDRSRAIAYGPGSFIELPSGTPHFEWLIGEVEAQVTHVGPLTTIFIRSDTDWPRRKEPQE